MPASGREIVLGVTGSIGAYKAADLVRRLKEQGCEVTCVLTKEAVQFVTPLTLQAISGRKVYSELFSLDDPAVIHTRLADEADLLLIAPATANILAKLAYGLADDLLTCIALATRAPLLVAPAMNVRMYEHPAVQENLNTLRARGGQLVGPRVGSLVCGYEAMGHVAEVEDIANAALALLAQHPSKLPVVGSPAGNPKAVSTTPRAGSLSRRR